MEMGMRVSDLVDDFLGEGSACCVCVCVCACERRLRLRGLDGAWSLNVEAWVSSLIFRGVFFS